MVQEGRRFGPQEFARFHPGGDLGRRLMRVGELMRRGLEGTKLVLLPASPAAAPPGSFEGEPLAQLLRVLEELDKNGLLILERRGLDVLTILRERVASVLVDR